MESERRTAAVVGVLFIIATVGSILGSAVLGSVLDGPDYLLGLSAEAGRVTAAVLCFIVAATCAFATSFLLFPILRPHAEGLAAGYVGLRTFENVFYVAGSIGILAMLTLSQHDAVHAAAPADVVALGTLLAALHTWAVVLGTLIFAGLGCLTLNVVLYPVTSRTALAVRLGADRRPRSGRLRDARHPRLRHRHGLTVHAPGDAARVPGDGLCRLAAGQGLPDGRSPASTDSGATCPCGGVIGPRKVDH